MSVKTFARAEDVIFLFGVDVSDLQVAFDAVELNRYRIQVVAVVLLRNFDVNGVTVKHWPHAAKVIRERARVPIGFDVGVAAEVQQ